MFSLKKTQSISDSLCLGNHCSWAEYPPIIPVHILSAFGQPLNPKLLMVVTLASCMRSAVITVCVKGSMRRNFKAVGGNDHYPIMQVMIRQSSFFSLKFNYSKKNNTPKTIWQQYYSAAASVMHFCARTCCSVLHKRKAKVPQPQHEQAKPNPVALHPNPEPLCGSQLLRPNCLLNQTGMGRCRRAGEQAGSHLQQTEAESITQQAEAWLLIDTLTAADCA